VQPRVGHATSLLVCGEGGGRKRADAEAMGVPARGEEEFYAWIDGLAAAGGVRRGRAGSGRAVQGVLRVGAG
jgi:BRCT domain type II-containing protein